MSKDKEKFLKAASEKQFFMYKGSSIRWKAYFSVETMEAGRQWNDI